MPEKNISLHLTWPKVTCVNFCQLWQELEQKFFNSDFAVFCYVTASSDPLKPWSRILEANCFEVELTLVYLKSAKCIFKVFFPGV